jgi:PBSX family phage terminase large subunit
MQLASSKQLEYWRDATHRWNFKTGATRSGKTYMDYYLLPRRLLSMAGKDGLNVILGNTRETIRRNIIIPMQEMYGERRVSSIRSDNSCTMFGQRVFCLGADNANHVDRLRGSSIKYCYGDEVTTWHPDVFDMLKSRLDKSYSVFDGTCNPDSPQHWLYEFLQSDADIFQQHYSIDDNPFLSPEFVENLKKEYAGTVLYDRYINGLWVAAEGALFTTYPQYTDDGTLLRDGIAHIDAAYGGADYTAFTCGKRQGGTIYLYGRLWSRHVDTVLDTCISEAKRLLCGPIHCEANADKGYLAKEINERGYEASTYNEFENKHIKISTFLRKWWGNVVFLSGTDKAYIAQILSYTQDAEHDDAPDSAACVCRYYDRRG